MSALGLTLFLLGTFAVRVAGGFILGRQVNRNETFTRLAGLVPLSIVAAVVAVQTFTTRHSLVLDARVAGVAAACVASWRRLPMVVVVVVAALVTAGIRWLGWAH